MAIPSRDDFTQGPLKGWLEGNGVEERIAYWKKINEKLSIKEEVRSFYMDSMKTLDEIEAKQVTIWPGLSCHDILMTGWLLDYLKDRIIDWYIVDLSMVGEDFLVKGKPVVNLAMYTPEKLFDLYKYRRQLSIEDKKHFSEIWNKASEENSSYRIKLGNEILSVGENYYDTYILSFITDEYQVTKFIIGQILRDGLHSISDTTVEWNIRKLIDIGLLEFEGELSTMDLYAVRKNSDL